jgi:hypothetical protein
MLTREGNFNIFRLGLILSGIGIVALVVGIIVLVTDQASYRAPLEIAPYPDAIFRGIQPESPVAQTQRYEIPGVEPETVAEYYQQQLDSHYGQDENTSIDERVRCIRFEYESPESQVPFQYTCVFDRATFNASHYTEVIIQPGIEEQNTAGSTVVAHRQRWEP